ncbi:MAG: LOG family protein [Calditrichaeota bacterium]|nr:LOG family protein [Calditrichota bacterium]
MTYIEDPARYPVLSAISYSVLDDGWFKVLAQQKRQIPLERGGNGPLPFIAVFGSAQVDPASAIWQNAFRLGVELARRGAVVINGGYGGLMEASSAGARSAGGITVGVTCDNLPEDAPNPYIDHEWKTDRWDQRLLALVWLADGYCVLPGSSGTMVELAMVVETQLKGFIPRRPIVCLTRFWQPVVRRVVAEPTMVQFAPTPRECANLVLK